MPRYWLKLAALVLIGLIGGSLAGAAPAGSISIIRPHPAFGEKERINAYRLSPDEATIVYKAGDFSTGANGLYSVPRRGGSDPVRASRSEDTGRITEYAVTPDSQSVIYNIGSALISVSLDGTDAQTITLPLTRTNSLSEEIRDFWIAPDQESVVYAIETYPHTYTKLMRVDLDGAAPVQLAFHSGLLFVDGMTAERLVYRTSPEQGRLEMRLHSIPLRGGQAVAMTAGLSPDQTVEYKVVISPDGQRAVFPVDNTITGGRQLYEAPLTGSGLVLLSDPDHRDVVYGRISPDSQSIIYIRGWEYPGELFRVSRGGGAVTKLSGSLDIDLYDDRTRLDITPDSQRVVFVASTATGSTPNHQLFSVPLSGGAPTPLSAVSSVYMSFVIAQSGQTVVYGHSTGSGRNILYKVPISGGAPTVLSGFLGESSNLQMLRAPGIGHTVIAVNFGPSVYAAYAIDLRFGTAKLLNPAPFESLYVDREHPYTVTKSGDVVFVARDSNSPSQAELFVTLRDDQPISVFLPFVRR